jgi:hypothetical protein
MKAGLLMTGLRAGLRYCHLGGRLVNALGAVPASAFDVVPPRPMPDMACNAMVCGTCHERLVSVRRRVAVRGLSLAEGRELFGRVVTTGSPQREAELDFPGLVADDFYRVWSCACGIVRALNRSRFAADPGADDMSTTIPEAWRCAGHPVIDTVAAIDGVSLPASVEEAAALTVALARGTERPAMPEWLGARSDAWLVRLLHLFGGTEVGLKLARGVVAALATDDGQVVHLAARVLSNWQAEPVDVETIDQALAAAVMSLDGSVARLAWRERRETAADVLMDAMADRVSLGSKAVEAAAWHMVSWHAKGRSRLLGALAGRFPDVFIASPEKGGPLARADIIAMLVAMAREGGREQAAAFIDAVRSLGVMPADSLEELARVNVPRLVPSA